MPALRERKKRDTRRRIAEAARALFFERGFDAVTVAEVAIRADVSQATVFNYFPAKEDLFFAGLEAFEQRLTDAVRERSPGESALDAFRRAMLESVGRLSAPDVVEMVRRAARLIADSRTLQRREREILARHTDGLARLLAEEADLSPDDVEARVVAGSLIAVHRAVLDRIRAEAVSGRQSGGLAEIGSTAAERAFARLERGLGDYAVRNAPEPAHADSATGSPT